MKTFLVIFGVFSLFLAAAIIGSYQHLFSPPNYSPADYLARQEQGSDKPVLICVGDSITHGHVSESYVVMLREYFGDSTEVINAGRNSDLAYNVFERLDQIIACDPDIITVLVGTNDANKSFDAEVAAAAVEKQRLPTLPSAEEYEKHLSAVLAELKQNTRARIALLSPPSIGESPGSAIYSQSRTFTQIAKKVALAAEVEYLPLFEELDKRIVPMDRIVSSKQSVGMMYGSIARHYLLGYTFDRIAKKNGYMFHPDELHLNSAGAEIVSSLIIDFVEGTK